MFNAIDVMVSQDFKNFFNLWSIVEVKRSDFTDKATQERDKGTLKSEKDYEGWEMETRIEQKLRKEWQKCNPRQPSDKIFNESGRNILI